jgi:PBP1b-binding outer membrane lipoprotein LpoB
MASTILILLAMVFVGCHEDKEDDESYKVFLDNIEVPYHPKSVNDIPDWLQDKVKRGEIAMICQGSYKAQPVYNFHYTYASHVGGNYDKDGQLLDVSTIDVHNWVCIYLIYFDVNLNKFER